MTLSKVALIGFAMALCLPVAGQEVPKAEIFGGYSFLSVSNKNSSDRQSLNGWEAAASANITKLFAVEGDVSGHYKSVTVKESLGLPATTRMPVAHASTSSRSMRTS